MLLSGEERSSGEQPLKWASQTPVLFTEVALADNFAEFLTIPAYERMP